MVPREEQKEIDLKKKKQKLERNIMGLLPTIFGLVSNFCANNSGGDNQESTNLASQCVLRVLFYNALHLFLFSFFIFCLSSCVLN